jgi:hypothetical protein
VAGAQDLALDEARVQLAEDVELPHAPGDQVRVLGPEVQNRDLGAVQVQLAVEAGHDGWGRLCRAKSGQKRAL